MIAILFAMQIVDGKRSFASVPIKLQQPVADVLLVQCGLAELVPSTFGGTRKK